MWGTSQGHIVPRGTLAPLFTTLAYVSLEGKGAVAHLGAQGVLDSSS